MLGLEPLASKSILRPSFPFNIFPINTNITSCSYNILMTVVKNHEVADPSEVSRILSILGTYSYTTTLIPLLQRDKSLLIDAVYLLRMVHDAGKYNPNCIFASIKDMNEIADKEKMENDPVFGFKRDLIRLVGNMCHKHKSNQDQVRLVASNK